MTTDHPYRRDIDGLRAVAVLAIVVYHAFPALLPGGFVGVDVFFVISGFLITRIIAEQRDAGHFSWGGFYLRRARRILPALFVVGLATAVLAAWIEMPRQLTQTGAALGVSALFSGNILFALNRGYFDPGLQQNPLLHLWSLGVEEQFYLVWPLLIAGLSFAPVRRARPWLAATLLIVSLAIAQKQLMGGASNGAFFGLPARAWEFLAGGVLSLGFAPPPGGARTANAAAATGLVLIAASVTLLNEHLAFPGLSALPACLGAALVLWSGQGRTPGVTAFLRSAPAVGVGQISYSLYLWHWPLLVLAAETEPQGLSLPQRAALVFLAFALAIATWRFIEQPWRRGPMGKPWRRLAPLLASMVVLFCAGAVLFFSHGLPGRLSPSARAAADIEIRDVNPQRLVCFGHPGALPATGCRFGAAADARDYDVLVWGDSHGDAVTPGVVAWAAKRGWSVREATQGGCPPFTDKRIPLIPVIEPGCRGTTREVLEEIAANPKLKLVVLAARWPLYRDAPPFYDLNSPRIGVAPAFAPRVNALAPSLRDTLDALSARSHARIMIIGPVPELTFIPPECVAQARHLHRKEQACWSGPAGPPLARARPAEAEIRAALADRPTVGAVFPSTQLCSRQTCVSAMDGRLIYFDDDHLSASGAQKLVPAWIDQALVGR